MLIGVLLGTSNEQVRLLPPRWGMPVAQSMSDLRPNQANKPTEENTKRFDEIIFVVSSGRNDIQLKHNCLLFSILVSRDSSEPCGRDLRLRHYHSRGEIKRVLDEKVSSAVSSECNSSPCTFECESHYHRPRNRHCKGHIKSPTPYLYLFVALPLRACHRPVIVGTHDKWAP